MNKKKNDTNFKDFKDSCISIKTILKYDINQNIPVILVFLY